MNRIVFRRIVPFASLSSIQVKRTNGFEVILKRLKALLEREGIEKCVGER